MFRKVVCPLLTVYLFCLALSSCSSKNVYALTVDDAEVPPEVYAYYLDKVYARPASFGLGISPARDKLHEKAAQLCAEYVAVNSLFSQLGMSLGFEDKIAVSQAVNSRWRLFSHHYESIGVSKQTLTKIEGSAAAEKALFLEFYDTGGLKAVGEEEARAYYEQNYTAFRAINGYLTKTGEDGGAIPLTDTEKNALKSKFNAMAVDVTDGESFESVGLEFAAEQSYSQGSSGTTVIKKGDNSYPEGFYDAVAALKTGFPTVLEFDDYLFLVVREEPFGNEEATYNEYRAECLKALKGDEFDADIAKHASAYPVTENDRVIRRVSKQVLGPETSR